MESNTSEINVGGPPSNVITLAEPGTTVTVRLSRTRGPLPPREAACYLAAMYRPADTPTCRGITPAAQLAIADFYDDVFKRLAAGEAGGGS